MTSFASPFWNFVLGWIGMGGIIMVLLVSPPVQAQNDGLSLGASLSEVNTELKKGEGTSVSVEELMGEEGTAFVFWSNQCPWTNRYEDRLQGLVQEYQDSGIEFVLVNANDNAETTEESLEAIQIRADRRGYQATYVRDSDARLARVLGASRTPHVYVLDGGGTLVYKGAIDDSPSGPSQVEQSYLRDALEALVTGETPENTETEAFGCTLKYPE